jgi:phospholipid transport system substrate-binding protein
MKSIAVSVCLVILAVATAVAAPAGDPSKPIKTIIGSVRQGRDRAALKLFAADAQGLALLGDDWAKATDAQRSEFTSLYQTLFAKIVFPKLRENFKTLSSITYEPAKIAGNTATLSSTIILDHPMKKQELKVRYTLVKLKAGWLAVDAEVLGDSILAGLRDDQIAPLVKQGGWDALLAAMRKKADELKNVPLK